VYPGLPLQTGCYIRESCEDETQLLHAAHSVKPFKELAKDLISPSKRRRTSPKKPSPEREQRDQVINVTTRTRSEHRQGSAHLKADMSNRARPKRSQQNK
jgi:hypothetical protein